MADQIRKLPPAEEKTLEEAHKTVSKWNAEQDRRAAGANGEN